MVTREILKNEIDKVPETKWELLLQMMQSLETTSGKNDQFIIFVNSGWHKVIQEAKTEKETEEIHNLYFNFIQSLKSSQDKGGYTAIEAPSDWHEFVHKFAGICKDDPIERADQGELEKRKEFE